MPKLILLSDTHGLEESISSVPDGDILIHAGDMSTRGKPEEIERFNRWIGTLPHPHKIIIAGNHDFYFERSPLEARKLITNAIYLQDSSVEILGYRFYGSPWQPAFFNWAFNVRRGKPLADIWSKIPADTDVLITHGPPAGILDKTKRGEAVGCSDLLYRAQNLPQLKLHVFGHIHEAYGQVHLNGVRYVNASICTLEYQALNNPIEFLL